MWSQDNPRVANAPDYSAHVPTGPSRHLEQGQGVAMTVQSGPAFQSLSAQYEGSAMDVNFQF